MSNHKEFAVTKKINFLKGHMGGNKILLLDGSQILEEELLSTALYALDELTLSGHQAGILYPPERGGSVRVRIVSTCGGDFIAACGGLSQVLSRAMVDTELGQKYNVKPADDECEIAIEFDKITVKTKTSLKNGVYQETNTDFTSFAKDLLLRGIEKINLGDIEAWRVGYFFVIDADRVKDRYPEVNFEVMDGATKEIITLLQYRFLGATGITSWDSACFDHKSHKDCNFRAFFPHNARTGHVEASCGTGSIALALAFLANGEAQFLGDKSSDPYILKLETGGKPVLGGPDVTHVQIERDNGVFKNASFSNSNVEILATGQLTI